MCWYNPGQGRWQVRGGELESPALQGLRINLSSPEMRKLRYLRVNKKKRVIELTRQEKLCIIAHDKKIQMETFRVEIIMRVDVGDTSQSDSRYHETRSRR